MTDVQLEGVTPLLDSSSLKVENSTNNNQNGLETEVEEAEDDTPCIDIIINNVVCTFSTRCHLNLRTVAMEGANVEYKREQGIRHPDLMNYIKFKWNISDVQYEDKEAIHNCQYLVFGKITCTGATSEPYAKIAARKFARQLQRIGFDVKFSNFKVVNVLGTCSMPFKIKVADMARKYPREVSYEPELHPGATYRIKEPKATLKIFTTGSITVTAPCVDNVQSAIEHIFPLVAEFKAVKSEVNAELLMKEARFIQKHRVIKPKRPITKFEEDLEYEDSSEEDFDSEEDQD